MIRVAFTLIGGKDWMGGQNYLYNLLDSLVRYQSKRLAPVLFTGEDCRETVKRFQTIKGLDIISTPFLNSRRRKISLLQALFLGKDVPLQKLFKGHQIDLIFEAAQFFGWRVGIPAIAWIPDFQHKLLPHMFPVTRWLKREFGFRLQLAGRRTVMVSSEDAKFHCEHHYSLKRNIIRTIHFAIPPGSEIQHQTAREVADSYGLPQHFFFIPNQFYQHKNHELVLEAMALLRQRGERIVVAASGNQTDPRNPGYFSDFLKKLKKYHLEKEFKLLGMIPYSHLLSLMCACTAMLNPSLFEGWSTTVEEARVTGTPMVLSDLAVHKEQMQNQATYFNRYSAQSLADALSKCVQLSVEERRFLSKAARFDGYVRVKRFSEDFFDLAKTCLEKSRQS